MLRDQIAGAARDVPPLVAQDGATAASAARRAEVGVGEVDASSPYFLSDGRSKARASGRCFLSWPHHLPRSANRRADRGLARCPSSRLLSLRRRRRLRRVFGDRLVEGEVLVRRSLAISDANLRRIGAPQGTFMRRVDGRWVRAGWSATQLRGGAGTAPRPSHYKPVGRLGGALNGQLREDKFLPEIAALIDARQFELITRPESGLVVIQGGAGSGKTTIGLHRLAYLAYQDQRRFRPERMLVVVFNDALARYISHVLPALGVQGVPVTTMTRARKARSQHSRAAAQYTDDTPDVSFGSRSTGLAAHQSTTMSATRAALPRAPAACSGRDIPAWSVRSRCSPAARRRRCASGSSACVAGRPMPIHPNPLSASTCDRARDVRVRAADRRRLGLSELLPIARAPDHVRQACGGAVQRRSDPGGLSLVRRALR